MNREITDANGPAPWRMSSILDQWRAQRRHSTQAEAQPQATMERETHRRRSMDMAPKDDESIPTSIEPMVGNLSSSQSSIISEVTIMTYSEEKAEMLRREFVRRVKQRDGNGKLSVQEGQALMSEIQQEIESKLSKMQKEQELKYEREACEKIKNQEPQRGSGETSNLLSRLRALKSEQVLVGKEQSPRNNDYNVTKSQSEERLPGHKETKIKKTASRDRLLCHREIMTKRQQIDGGQELEFKAGTITEAPMRWNVRRERMGLGGLVQSFSSMGTGKIGNSKVHSSGGVTEKSFSSKTDDDDNHSSSEIEGKDLCKGAEHLAKNHHVPATKAGGGRDRQGPEQEGGSSQASEPFSQRGELNIEKIIELKFLVANQQATIDTLSSKLHNVELANRQLRHANETKIKLLEAENRTLADQLNGCREREISLRHEMRLIQESNQGKDNETLMRENAELRYQLALLADPIVVGKMKKRTSMDTVTTTASTDVDSVANTL